MSHCLTVIYDLGPAGRMVYSLRATGWKHKNKFYNMRALVYQRPYCELDWSWEEVLRKHGFVLPGRIWDTSATTWNVSNGCNRALMLSQRLALMVNYLWTPNNQQNVSKNKQFALRGLRLFKRQKMWIFHRKSILRPFETWNNRTQSRWAYSKNWRVLIQWLLTMYLILHNSMRLKASAGTT